MNRHDTIGLALAALKTASSVWACVALTEGGGTLIPITKKAARAALTDHTVVFSDLQVYTDNDGDLILG